MALTKAQRKRIEGYERDNRECAAIILADAGKYGGEGSCAIEWARLVLSKPKTVWPTGDLDDEESETAGYTPGRF